MACSIFNEQQTQMLQADNKFIASYSAAQYVYKTLLFTDMHHKPGTCLGSAGVGGSGGLWGRQGNPPLKQKKLRIYVTIFRRSSF